MPIFFYNRPSIFFALLIMVTIPQGASSAPKKATKQIEKQLTVKQVAQLVLPSVVRLTVLSRDGVPAVQGSGLVVGDDLIATNLHVVAGGHAVTANFENGRSETVFGVVGVDSEHDLVLLRAFTHGVRPLKLEQSTNIQVGEPVVAVGSPEGLGGSISTGVVSGIRLYNASKVIQTTAPISHGSSGGGLINMNGQIIGVTSFFNVEGQNLNFAYPAFFLQQLIVHQAKQILTWKQIEDYQKQRTATTPPHPPVIPNGTTSRSADTAVYTSKPFSGVKEVKIIVEDIAADAKLDGLDADPIRAAVEIRLRQGGVPVVEKLSSGEQKPWLLLDVNINTLAVNDGASYVYSIRIETSERVTLRRDVPVKIWATTWTDGNFGIVPKTEVAEISKTVNIMVDKFVNDFSSQNSDHSADAGMDGKQKGVRLAGASLLFYLYKHSQAQSLGATGLARIYLEGKGTNKGALYYRKNDANHTVVWLQAPAGGVQVPADQAQQALGNGFDPSNPSAYQPPEQINPNPQGGVNGGSVQPADQYAGAAQ